MVNAKNKRAAIFIFLPIMINPP